MSDEEILAELDKWLNNSLFSSSYRKLALQELMKRYIQSKLTIGRIRGIIKKQQKEIEIIRCLLYKIRNIAKEILIYTHGDNGELGPIKNHTKQEVYSGFVEIRNIVNGQYVFLDNTEAINKKIEECIKRGKNENS